MLKFPKLIFFPREKIVKENKEFSLSIQEYSILDIEFSKLINHVLKLPLYIDRVVLTLNKCVSFINVLKVLKAWITVIMVVNKKK